MKTTTCPEWCEVHDQPDEKNLLHIGAETTVSAVDACLILGQRRWETNGQAVEQLVSLDTPSEGWGVAFTPAQAIELGRALIQAGQAAAADMERTPTERGGHVRTGATSRNGERERVYDRTHFGTDPAFA